MDGVPVADRSRIVPRFAAICTARPANIRRFGWLRHPQQVQRGLGDRGAGVLFAGETPGERSFWRPPLRTGGHRAAPGDLGPHPSRTGPMGGEGLEPGSRSEAGAACRRKGAPVINGPSSAAPARCRLQRTALRKNPGVFGGQRRSFALIAVVKDGNEFVDSVAESDGPRLKPLRWPRPRRST
jgi:hypothetical protein